MTAGPEPVDAPVDPVLARYTEGLRPLRRRYALIVAAAIVLLVAGVTATWLTGEGRATTLEVATDPEPAVANVPLGSTLTVAWTSDDATAGGITATQGTIVTYGEHAVRGRNALTGEVRWSYTRTDVTVCDVVTQDGVAVAVFRKNGNCDQVVGLDAVTGQRRYNRTLQDSGDSTMSTRSGSTMIVSAHGVHVISPGFDEANVPAGGLDRWYWTPEDCAVDAAVIGGRGVLTALSCGSIDRLVLRKPYEDGEFWSIEDSARPLVVTDAAVLGWDAAASTLVSFALETGARVAALPLTDCADPVATEVGGLAMLLCGGDTLRAFAADGGTLAPVWAIPAVALPVVQSTLEVGDGRMVVIGPDGARTVAVATGAAPAGAGLTGPAVLPAAAQAALADASRVERNGAGLLIAGTGTMMLRGAG